jgi:hypothetical protein
LPKNEPEAIKNDSRSEYVSVDLASKIALNFTNNSEFFREPLEDNYDLKSSPPFSDFENKEIADIFVVNDDNDIPAIYIFNFEPSGFIILSATKREYPILGYSNNSNIDINNFQLGFSDWLSIRKARIQKYRNEKDMDVSESITEIWASYAPPPGEEEVIPGADVFEELGPLMQTTWGQGSPYNSLLDDMECTTYNNGRPLTGCVATATAQIMRYWEHPNSYDWSIMPDITWNFFSSPTPGELEIAQLMYDIGDVVDMDYGCAASNALSNNIVSALENTFDYSEYIQFLNFNTVNIISQLDNGYPVILSGVDAPSGDGHAWVCDGYQRLKHVLIHNPGTIYEYETYTISDFYLQMNWGFNSYYDGWYLYDDFTIGDHNFTSSLGMIINIYP